MGRNRLIGVVALAALLSACTPQAASDTDPVTMASKQAPSVHPVSGLEVIPLTVESGGKPLAFRVELADTREEQAKGLMFRPELGEWEGMIFPSEKPTARSFWMKNTPIPLDIIFIGTDGRILNIAAMAEPYSLDSVYSTGSTSGVLELRGGRAAELGIEPGDLVTW